MRQTFLEQSLLNIMRCESSLKAHGSGTLSCLKRTKADFINYAITFYQFLYDCHNIHHHVENFISFQKIYTFPAKKFKINNELVNI